MDFSPPTKIRHRCHTSQFCRIYSNTILLSSSRYASRQWHRVSQLHGHHFLCLSRHPSSTFMPVHLPSKRQGRTRLRTLNDITRTLMFQAYMPPAYWAEALAVATFLLNHCPSQALDFRIPYTLLYQKPPSFSDLRVFGCLCYPNQSATAPHKLAPRSTACVFLGYPASHRGYRCPDLTTHRIIISRHVIFDEHTFPFATT